MTRLCRAGDADRHIYYHVKKEEEEYAREKLASFSRPIITIHPLTGTRIKRWKEAYWKELADLFQEKKYTTVLVGSKDDTTGIPQSMDLRNSITLREAVAVVKVSDVFVGLDSFFAHAAGAVRTPRVVLFGSTDPDRLACDLDVCPTEILRGCCPHFGCRHDCLPDQWPRNIECRLGTVACMDTITPHVVCEAVDRLLSRNSQEET
jgi:ADP-heptose:LPS heptosyltransferase